MRLLIFIGIFLFVKLPVIYSQEPDFIRGKVIDSKTSAPVPFAAVHLKKAQVGIYSNAEGDFRIMNNSGYQSDDSLIVTCIGFNRLSVAFNALKSSNMNIIKLVPNIYGLKEVRVTARKKRLNSEIIIARALNNIKKNNSALAFNFVSYYRDYLKDSVNYLNLNEAIIQTLDKGFGSISDSNRYRLLAFRKNLDFARKNISPYYDLPETDHTDKSFKTIPHAVVGDHYGNEFYVLLAHDPFRNYYKRSFSFVDTLMQNFIHNHWFSSPIGIYDGRTLLYKIEFTAKNTITPDIYEGAIYIQPDDYSIHKLEYSGSYLDSDKKKKRIFSIEIEYGREPAVNSSMCLKYMSFNNTFSIPDSADNNFFKLLNTDWWVSKFLPQGVRTIILAEFNRKVDPASGKKLENYTVSLGKKQAKITNIKVDGVNVFITVRNDHFSKKEYDSTFVSVKNLKDINGNILNKRRDLEFRQFRELFVQEYNKPLEFQNNCFIQAAPLEKNCISISENSGKFWMNSPLKEEEKRSEK